MSKTRQSKKTVPTASNVSETSTQEKMIDIIKALKGVNPRKSPEEAQKKIDEILKGNISEKTQRKKASK